ncbi:O-methyltransferase [Rhodovarius lipocyclicus]|uniref:O-methyltransferase n=1 Tax=Rhodovarius lipocyclicus TaxID=268410 RepID=UPI001356D260|nr:hypothetical protein [Rhodovarius lipocyclicus]
MTQSDAQDVVGPIQDDEALFLFSLVRVLRCRNILEIGGLDGYSARNFLAAMGEGGTLFTVDLSPVPQLGENHVVIVKDCAAIEPADIRHATLDLLFFDAHAYDAQLELFMRLTSAGAVDEHTVLALHDTNLHPHKFVPWSYETEGGFVHQAVERRLVNELKSLGYDAFSLHPPMSRHQESLPYRHGLTVMQKYRALSVTPLEPA